jgi:hypothetical protein
MERSQDIEDEDTMTFFGGAEGDADESQACVTSPLPH